MKHIFRENGGINWTWFTAFEDHGDGTATLLWHTRYDNDYSFPPEVANAERHASFWCKGLLCTNQDDNGNTLAIDEQGNPVARFNRDTNTWNRKADGSILDSYVSPRICNRYNMNGVILMFRNPCEFGSITHSETR